MKKKNIFEKIKKTVKNNIKIIGISALLLAFISPLAQNISNSIWNIGVDLFYKICGHSIEYQDGTISRLSLSDNPNESFYNIKEASRNLPSVMNKGCMLNSYIRNKRDKGIGISRCSLVVKDIKEIKRAKPIFIAYTKNDEMKIIAINNGNSVMPEGTVVVVGKYVDKNGNHNELTKTDFYNMFSTREIEIPVPALNKGEILEIASWKIKNSNVRVWEKYFDSSWLNLIAKYTESRSGKTWNDIDMGCLKYSSGKTVIFYGQGEADDYVITRAVVLDRENQNDSIIKTDITTDFYIDANSDKNIQINILPTSSCNIKFYAEFSAAGERKIQTDTFEKEIEVPVYELDDFYKNILDVIRKNNIQHYEFNSDLFIQDQIEYDPYKIAEQIT